MDRCAVAYEYHKEGFNCAQCVVGAFLDKLDLTPEQAMAACGGLGGGYGGSHTEACGALSGGAVVLGLLNPHTVGVDIDAKKHIYAVSKEFHRRYGEAFGGLTRCGDLLKARPGQSERTPAAVRLGITSHCDIMIVTAVEIVEQMLEELAAEGQG